MPPHPKPPMRGLARVAFRALQPTIETELKEGWTAKSIYDRHSDKLAAISYPQFVRYCRLLKPSAKASAPPTHETEVQASSVRKTFDDHEGIADPALIRKLTFGDEDKGGKRPSGFRGYNPDASDPARIRRIIGTK